MEHSIPQVIVDRLIRFAEFVEVCPRGGSGWIKGFGYYCENGIPEEACERCILHCLEEAKKRKKRGAGVDEKRRVPSKSRGRSGKPGS